MSTVTPSVDHVDDALLEDYEVEPGDGPGPGGHPFAVSSEAGWGKSGIQSHHHVAIAGSAKRTSVEDAVLCLGLGTPPAFELHGELFHVFISYRVKTEGGKDGGNSLAGNLYKYLRQLSNGEEELNIPSAACGLYPRFAKKLLSDDSANKPTVAKVYLDVECLQDGQAWMVGFVQGLSVSIVAVLLVPCPHHFCLVPPFCLATTHAFLVFAKMSRQLSKLGSHDHLAASKIVTGLIHPPKRRKLPRRCHGPRREEEASALSARSRRTAITSTTFCSSGSLPSSSKPTPQAL